MGCVSVPFSLRSVVTHVVRPLRSLHCRPPSVVLHLRSRSVPHSVRHSRLRRVNDERRAKREAARTGVRSEEVTSKGRTTKGTQGWRYQSKAVRRNENGMEMFLMKGRRREAWAERQRPIMTISIPPLLPPLGPSFIRHLRFLLPFGAPTGRIVTREGWTSEETAHGAPGEGE